MVHKKNKSPTQQVIYFISFICGLIFLLSASKGKISSKKGFHIESNDSVKIYEIKMDTLLSAKKYLRIQIFDETKYMDNQELISYHYCNSKSECLSIETPKIDEEGIVRFPNAEITGQISKPDSYWIHPPRSEYFKILELNAFPYFVKNQNNWKYNLNFGEHWADERWSTWAGRRTSNTLYKLAKSSVEYEMGMKKIKCFKVVANTKIEGLGKTKSIFYYNEEYGFVYMRFKTINNQIIEFRMI